MAAFPKDLVASLEAVGSFLELRRTYATTFRRSQTTFRIIRVKIDLRASPQVITRGTSVDQRAVAAGVCDTVLVHASRWLTTTPPPPPPRRGLHADELLGGSARAGCVGSVSNSNYSQLPCLAAETPARRRWLVTQVVGAAPTAATGLDYGRTQIATALPVSIVSQTNCSSRWKVPGLFFGFTCAARGRSCSSASLGPR